MIVDCFDCFVMIYVVKLILICFDSMKSFSNGHWICFVVVDYFYGHLVLYSNEIDFVMLISICLRIEIVFVVVDYSYGHLVLYLNEIDFVMLISICLVTVIDLCCSISIYLANAIDFVKPISIDLMIAIVFVVVDCSYDRLFCLLIVISNEIENHYLVVSLAMMLMTIVDVCSAR